MHLLSALPQPGAPSEIAILQNPFPVTGEYFASRLVAPTRESHEPCELYQCRMQRITNR